MEHQEGTLKSKDALEIYWQSWKKGVDPKAIVLIVHGLGEHSGRYSHVATSLCEKGFACYALDYRGHGRAEGTKVHIDNFGQFLDDLATMRELVAERHKELPHFILAHSQGGLIALSSVLRNPHGLRGIVVSSPFLGIHPSSKPSAALAVVAQVISKLAPTLRLDNGVNAEFVSRDTEVVDAYLADPLVSSKVSARWFTEILTSQSWVMGEARRLAIPALVMQSGGDRLVDPDATRKWCDDAPAHLVEYVDWEGLYHEMLNEPEQEQVLVRIGQWLDGQLSRT